MPLLQISERQSSKHATNPIVYSIRNTKNGRQIEQALALPTSETDAEEIRWYLEDYAVKDCFEVTRASKAANCLQKLGRYLVSAIGWENILESSDLDQPLAIHIDQSTITSERHIFWELLEQAELWPASIRPSVITVTRTIIVAPTSVSIQPKANRAFNILVCAARPESEQDIPHRLVSRNILEVSSNRVNIEIVRPATFAAFSNSLREKEVGYFDLVHFDLHGIEDTGGKICLGFLKNDEQFTVQPDLISPHQVGQLLQEYGAHQVILNACRSARGSSAETNVAMALLHAGISTIVGMSYSIADRAVEVFTKSLYTTLFDHGCNLSEATRLSRKTMSLNPSRISRFGDPIDVLDFSVPITYCRTFMSDSGEKASLFNIAVEDMDFNARFPYGREDDILHLESILLIAKKPVLLHGQAGMGKTCLLQHLRQWWKSTGLINDSLVIQMYKEYFVSAESLFMRLHRYFLNIKKYTGPEAIIKYLHSTPCFIGLDAIESMVLPASITLRKQIIEFKKVIKSLEGGKTIIVVASRRKEGWLSEHTRRHSLQGLHIMAGLEQISGILAGAARILNIPSYDTPQDKQFFEQIIKLVDGNPLAIRLLTQNFLCSFKSVRNYFFDLLGGAAIIINWREAEELEGLRSLVEINELSEALSPKSIGDGFIPQVMAPFWKTIPTAEFPTFVNLWNSQSAKQLGGSSTRGRIDGFKAMMASLGQEYDIGMTPEFENLFNILCQVSDATQDAPEAPTNLPSTEELLLLWDEFEIGADFPFQNLVLAACRKIISSFQAASFLEDMDVNTVSPEFLSKDFMTVHPLLPIVFRSYSFYESNHMGFTNSITTAFSLFYAYRSKRWPWSKIYFDSAWEEPRKELHLEFYNFSSAAEIALRKEDTKGQDAALQQAVISRVLIVFPRGALKDASRIKIAAELSERALSAILKQTEDCEVEGSRNMSFKTSSELEDDALKLFNSRFQAIIFAWQLQIQYQRLKSSKADHFLNIIVRLVDDLLRDGVPEALANYQSRLVRAFEYTKTLCIASRHNSMKLEEMWNMRQDYFRSQAQEAGLESFNLAQTQRGWQDIQIDTLAPLATQAHIFTTVIQAREAIKEGNLSQARKLVDKTLMNEINEGGNDDMNKATLIDLICTIDEKEGKWDDALRHCDQAHALEESARNGEESLSGDLQWKIRRARLLRGYESQK